MTRIKEKPVLKMLSGVLGVFYVKKVEAEKEAKAKLDKYLAKRNTQSKSTTNWDLTFLK